MKGIHHHNSISAVVKIEKLQGVLDHLAMTQQIACIFLKNVFAPQIAGEELENGDGNF